MTRATSVMVLTIGLSSGAVSAGDTPGNALDAQALQALMAGNTLYSETRLARFAREPVRTFQLYLHPDGTLTIRNLDGNTDTGTWEILPEGQFCSQYRHTRRGMRKCYEVIPVQEGDYAYGMRDLDTDTVSSVFDVRPGNPENLQP